MPFIGLDLGGTNVKAGVVDNDGQVLSRWKQPVGRAAADRTSTRVVSLVADCARRVVEMAGLQMTDIKGIGIGCPGILDVEKGVVIGCSNFKDWHEVPLTSMLSAELSIPVKLENDANCALLAEAWVGAAKDKHTVVIVTLGTGIGGGILCEGNILRGSGMAGEVGHLLLQDEGRPCGCGQRGCWETYASGTGIARSAAEKKLLREQFPDEHIDAKRVFHLADEGNPAAQEVINSWAGYMGEGLVTLSRVVDPEMIILAGGIATNAQVQPLVEAAFLGRCWRFNMGKPVIRVAQVGNDAGLIGAAYVGRAHAAFLRARM